MLRRSVFKCLQIEVLTNKKFKKKIKNRENPSTMLISFFQQYPSDFQGPETRTITIITFLLLGFYITQSQYRLYGDLLLSFTGRKRPQMPLCVFLKA
jgi:hypothetical protein